MFQRLNLCFTLLFLVPLGASAQNFDDFSEASFDTALETGQPVVINFYESWCSRCTTQRRNLQALLDDPAYEDVIVLEAVYGANRDFAASLGIHARTSLALIKDRTLVAIEVGGTSATAVEALLMAELADPDATNS